jgi:hypothetical protein
LVDPAGGPSTTDPGSPTRPTDKAGPTRPTDTASPTRPTDPAAGPARPIGGAAGPTGSLRPTDRTGSLRPADRTGASGPVDPIGDPDRPADRIGADDARPGAGLGNPSATGQAGQAGRAGQQPAGGRTEPRNTETPDMPDSDRPRLSRRVPLANLAEGLRRPDESTETGPQPIRDPEQAREALSRFQASQRAARAMLDGIEDRHQESGGDSHA